MEAWPFSEDDWDSVQEAVVDLVNAAEEEDDDLVAIKFKEVFDLLEALAIKYGPHPALFETKAYFLTNPEERVSLYKEAINLAETNSLQTSTIRLSLVRVLIEDFQDYEAARLELEACEGEVTDDNLGEWEELTEIIQRRGASVP